VVRDASGHVRGPCGRSLFKVNGQCLKLFLEPNNELEEVGIITCFLN
jgi:hypothetical protein